MLEHIANVHSFLWLYNLPLYVYTTFYSFLCWALGCSLLLAMVNDPTVNMGVQLSVQVPAFCSTGSIPRSWIAGSCSIFNLLRNLISFLGLGFQQYMSLLQRCFSVLPGQNWYPTPRTPWRTSSHHRLHLLKALVISWHFLVYLIPLCILPLQCQPQEARPCLLLDTASPALRTQLDAH